MTGRTAVPLVRWTPHVLKADPTRVVVKTFLPGQELLTLGSPVPRRCSSASSR